MDALSDILRVVRLTGGVFLEAKLTAPWSLITNVDRAALKTSLAPDSRIIAFHYVVAGRLVAQAPGAAVQALEAGDLILLPRNDLHVLGSGPGVPPVPASQLIQGDEGGGPWWVDHGGGGAETRLICGFLGGDPSIEPLVATLPSLLRLHVSQTSAGAWIAESFAFAARNMKSGAADATATLAKLSELMFVEAIRRYVDALPQDETGWLAGLRDTAVGRSLALMHADPQRDWSTEDLAAAVALSRSAFADRFTALMGRPPGRYLTAWRMQLAAQMLRDSRRTVAQIAFEVGYESEAAFNRAFRRELGKPPATWRKSALSS
jgi:AraC-like DNA-binding protein